METHGIPLNQHRMTTWIPGHSDSDQPGVQDESRHLMLHQRLGAKSLEARGFFHHRVLAVSCAMKMPQLLAMGFYPAFSGLMFSSCPSFDYLRANIA